MKDSSSRLTGGKTRKHSKGREMERGADLVVGSQAWL